MTDSKWQPIETAPKNGMPILAWGDILGTVAEYAWSPRYNRWAATHGGEDVIEYQGDFGTEYKFERGTLTHWKPLPRPPE